MKDELTKKSNTKSSVGSDQIMENPDIDYVNNCLKCLLYDEQRQQLSKVIHILTRKGKLLKKREENVKELEDKCTKQQEEIEKLKNHDQEKDEMIEELTEQNTKKDEKINMLTKKSQDHEQNKKERDQEYRSLLELSKSLAKSNEYCKCRVDKISVEVQTSENVEIEENDEITIISDDVQGEVKSVISQNVLSSLGDFDLETVCPSIDYQGSLNSTQVSSCSSLDGSVGEKENLVIEKFQHEFNMKSLRQAIMRKGAGFLKDLVGTDKP